MTEKAASSIAERLLRALEYMHSKGVIHRDLKPENVLYMSPECDKPILADFGVGKRLSGGATNEDRDQTGTVGTLLASHVRGHLHYHLHYSLCCPFPISNVHS